MQCDLSVCFPYQLAVKDSLNMYSSININLEAYNQPFQSSTQGLVVWALSCCSAFTANGLYH